MLDPGISVLIYILHYTQFRTFLCRFRDFFRFVSDRRVYALEALVSINNSDLGVSIGSLGFVLGDAIHYILGLLELLLALFPIALLRSHFISLPFKVIRIRGDLVGRLAVLARGIGILFTGFRGVLDILDNFLYVLIHYDRGRGLVIALVSRHLLVVLGG